MYLSNKKTFIAFILQLLGKDDNLLLTEWGEITLESLSCCMWYVKLWCGCCLMHYMLWSVVFDVSSVLRSSLMNDDYYVPVFHEEENLFIC